MVGEGKAEAAAPPAGGAGAPPLPRKLTWKVMILPATAAWDEYRPAWDDLAAHALEPNVFYESWMLGPALKAYGQGQEVYLALVQAELPGKMPFLGGLFPLQCCRRWKHLPIRVWRLWRYIHCYLCTPLLRASCARACLEAFFQWWAATPAAASLLEWGWIPGDGPFHCVLYDYLAEQRVPFFLDDWFGRAFLTAGTAATAGEALLSGEHRRKLRKRRQRLEALGPVVLNEFPGTGEGESWLAEFLALEASGWKGRQGTALGCQEQDRWFFLTVMREALQRGRVQLRALRVSGQPVAMQCDLLAPPGGYVFKIAFAETHAAYSPGVLLELERLRWFRSQSAVTWMDSCTVRGPTLFTELWPERRLMETLVLARGGVASALLALLPLWRWLRQSRQRKERLPHPTTPRENI